MERRESEQTFTGNCHEYYAALLGNVLFGETLNQRSIEWFPSDDQTCRELAHCQG
jgi:hypothetical protein